MRVLIAWGNEERLLNKILPREFFTANKKMRVKRMEWVIDKLDKVGVKGKC